MLRNFRFEQKEANFYRRLCPTKKNKKLVWNRAATVSYVSIASLPVCGRTLAITSHNETRDKSPRKEKSRARRSAVISRPLRAVRFGKKATRKGHFASVSRRNSRRTEEDGCRSGGCCSSGLRSHGIFGGCESLCATTKKPTLLCSGPLFSRGAYARCRALTQDNANVFGGFSNSFGPPLRKESAGLGSILGKGEEQVEQFRGKFL